MDQLLRYDEREDKEVVNIIVNATEGGGDAVAHMALKQLTNQMDDARDHHDRPVMTDALCYDLTMINYLTQGSSSATLRSLLCAGLVPAVVRFLNYIDSQNSSASDDVLDDFKNSMLAASSIIANALFSANGHSWVSQCIDAGLIPAILRSERWLRNIPADFSSLFASGIFTYLQQYLVYRSVLRAVGKALNDVKQMQISRDTSSSFWKDFNTFEEVALYRLALKKIFDLQIEAGSEPGFTGCENHVVSRPRNFKHAILTYVPLVLQEDG